MSDPNRTLLRIPQGTERFSLEEAARHRSLVHDVETFLGRWSYLPAQTPVVDFFDVYDPLLARADRRDVYRLIDRDGEVLMLRSDVTLFLAKQMGLLLREDDLPVRVYYADTILRHQEAYDISRNEFFQSGVELIGLPGTEGELEVLLLLCELLRHVGSPQFFCHIGSRSLFDASLAATEGSRIKAEDAAPARRALTLRRFDELESLTGRSFAPARRALFETIVGADEFLGRVASLQADLTPAERREIGLLSNVVRGLVDLGYEEHLRVDFSEIGNQPYHSGIAFQVYVDGVDSAVASGGRYDGLLARFGFDAASVGFSVMLRKLEPLLSYRHATPRARPIEGEDPVDRMERARQAVARGEHVRL